MKQPDPDVVSAAELTQSSNQLLLSSNETRDSNDSKTILLTEGSANTDLNTSTVDPDFNLTKTTVPSNGEFKNPVVISNQSSSDEIDSTASNKTRLSSTEPVNISKPLHGSSHNDSESLNNTTRTNMTMKILPTLATTLLYLSVLDVNHSSVVDVRPSVDVVNAGHDNHTTHFHQVPVTSANFGRVG